ncbi:MAG: tetratricopeptide repeat protein, partial [Kiritimatiellia bacterium]
VFLLPRLRRRDHVWLAVLATAFLMLGVGMMLLLNPAPDIQALFIARVQLVPAAAVYAVLIGYGLVVALRFCLQYLERLPRLPGRLLLGVLSALVLAAPAGLVWNNYHDEELTLAYGGAELRGHDFGWQFGNYQLRGAPAIMEELDPDEPPLPNPVYPPAMETNAIFFGGTDPGRFVPTYMIYSARVRPDVFLITQNALADNTYMNVMRDLYGDQIWMPTPQDVNTAFQTYVQDVQAGRLPRSAAIAIDPGGKVSVQGVQGVMEINGIISKMMFEMNKQRHAFYVEESYVIAWMYPYLEPHGLILKINPEPLPALTPEMVRSDMEFWTWYGNRLMNDRKFLRDATARKSFSKLRCAIAGLYVYRRMFAEAEAAFLQAVELAPLSPEANFRLADLYVQMGRFADALQVMERNAERDPRNDKIVDFINQVRELEGMHRRVEALQQNMSQGQATLEQVFELASLFLRTGREQPFMDLARQMLQDDSLPPSALLRLAEMAASSPSPPRLELVIQAFEKYLQREPSNARARHELACAYLARGQLEEVLRELRRAVDLGGEPMRTALRQDQRLAPLRTNQAFQRLLEPAARSGFRPPAGLVFP